MRTPHGSSDLKRITIFHGSGASDLTHKILSLRPVGGAKDLDARPVRKEERSESENLVISSEGLRRRSARIADAGDECCREPEAADLCDTPSA